MKRITVCFSADPRLSDVTMVLDKGPRRAPRNVLTQQTLRHIRHAARVGVDRSWCMGHDRQYRRSFALSVASLIRDVHSPMDCSPVHARWEVIY